jgi:hypothetical protein
MHYELSVKSWHVIGPEDDDTLKYMRGGCCEVILVQLVVVVFHQ